MGAFMDCVDGVEPHSPSTISFARSHVAPHHLLRRDNSRSGSQSREQKKKSGVLCKFFGVWATLVLRRSMDRVGNGEDVLLCTSSPCVSNILHVREGWSCGGDRICTRGGDRDPRSRGRNRNPRSRGGYRACAPCMHRTRVLHTSRRTTWIKKIDGGASALFKTLLTDSFGDGVPTVNLDLPGGVATITIEFAGLLADEEGLSMCFDTKGASGLLPCGTLCSVVNKPRQQDWEAGTALVQLDPSIADISHPSPPLRSNADVLRMVEQLRNCGADAVADLEMQTGIKKCLNGVLFAPRLRHCLRPADHTVVDPMHIVFSNGVLNQEIILFFDGLRATTSAYFKDFRDWFRDSGWTPTQCVNAFSEARELHSHSLLKAGASELICGYPPLRVFAVKIFGTHSDLPFVKSFLLLCEVCDIIMLILKHPPASEAYRLALRLRELCPRYLQTFTAAHGLMAVRFKHHQLLHLFMQILARRELSPGDDNLCLMPSCWVTERKNYAAKSAMAQNRSCSGFHKTLLSRMLATQIRCLDEEPWRTQLIEPTQEYPELALQCNVGGCRISKAGRVDGFAIKSGDVLFLDISRSRLVVVVALVCLGDATHGALVRLCSCNERKEHSAVWQVPTESSLHLWGDGECREFFLKATCHRYMSSERLEVLY